MAEYKAAKAVIAATASSLTTELGLSAQRYFQVCAVRADGGNAGKVWFGESNVAVDDNQGGYLNPGDGVSFCIENGYCNTSQLYFIAESADDVLYISMFY